MHLDFESSDRIKESLFAKAGYIVFCFVVALNIAYRCLTDVGVNWAAMLSLSTDGLIYLFSVYVTFCAMADTARRDAKKQTRYQEAYTNCKAVTEQAKPYRSRLADYVCTFLKEDVYERQKAFLWVAGVEMEDYLLRLRHLSQRQLKKAGFGKAERKAICHANRVKPQKISIGSLLSYEDSAPRQNPLLHPRRLLARRYGASLLPTTVMALFSAQIVFAVVANEDPRVVFVESLLRIGLLSWTALRGYLVGEKTVLSDSVDYLIAKTDFLSAFLAKTKQSTP